MMMTITTNSSAAIHWRSLLCCIVDLVSSSLQKELKSQYNSLSELLRHFWSCFPVKTQLLEEKVSDLYFFQSSSSMRRRRFGGRTLGFVAQWAKLTRGAQRKKFLSPRVSRALHHKFQWTTPITRGVQTGPHEAKRSYWWGQMPKRNQ